MGAFFLLSLFYFPPRGAAARMELEQPSLPYLYALVFLPGARRWFIYSDKGANWIYLGMQRYKTLLNRAGGTWHCRATHGGVKWHRAAALASRIGCWHRWKWTRCPVPVLVWMTGWDKLLQGVSKQQTPLFGSVFSVWCWLNNSVCNKQLMSIHLILEDTVNNRFYFPPSPNCCIEFHSL